MLSKFCSEMPYVGMVVFLYAVANFLALVGETTYFLASVFEKDADKPDYPRTGVYACVRVITMVMCAWWIRSANQVRTTRMKIAFAWIVIRAVAHAAYAYGHVFYELFLLPDPLVDFWDHPRTFSLEVQTSSATAWLLGEAFVLSRMYAFHRLATAPAESKLILEEEEYKQPAEVGEAVFGDQ
ncbi:uncharacterized protein LOC144139940 [Haemaphysalis longicornis]